MLISTTSRLAGAALLFLAAGFAQAQYVWIDANGTRQYADRPPPPGTPPHRILKAPGRLAPAPTPEASVEAASPAAGKKEAPSLAEREEAYKERVRQRALQERKDAEEAARKRDVAARCEAEREIQAQLATGMRIPRVDANGQRSFMSDDERAARAAQAERALKDCR